VSINIQSNQSIYERQNKELKKELEKSYKSIETLKKEISEVEDKFKKMELYTNFAKANKENYSKKDFSIQETMSRKVEELNVTLLI
jgi:RNA-splicing ligase RtcB